MAVTWWMPSSFTVPPKLGSLRIVPTLLQPQETRHYSRMDTAALRERIEEHVRALELIPPGGAVTCLVSGGADSTCLHHALGALGYTVSAVHVDHGLRGAESAADASFCGEILG